MEPKENPERFVHTFKYIVKNISFISTADLKPTEYSMMENEVDQAEAPKSIVTPNVEIYPAGNV